MMLRKVGRLIITAVSIILIMTNIVYAQPITPGKAPYGPKIEELKGKEEIAKNFQEIKRVRANLTAINITESSTDEQLQSYYGILNHYLQEFNSIRTNLERHELAYKDSFTDLFFAEQILFIADSYIISIRNQLNLIIGLQGNNQEAKQLFYSSYLIPVYYYLTLGDQMISYVETYFVVI